MNRTPGLKHRIYKAPLVSSWEFLSVLHNFLLEDTHSGAQHAAQNTELQRPQPQMGAEGTAVSLETLPQSEMQSWGRLIRGQHTPTGTHWLLTLPTAEISLVVGV